LIAGTYDVVIRDAAHTMCSQDLGNVIVHQPTALSGTTAKTDVNCFGGADGTITVTATGGWGTYGYSDNGGTSWQSSNVFTGLIAGTYAIVIHDAAHTICFQNLGNVIILQPTAPLGSTSTSTDVNCFSGIDGTITVTASGGWGTYEYSDNGGGIWQTSNIFSGLIAGTYDVVIRDAAHTMCTFDEGIVTIHQPAAPLGGSTTHTNVNCFDGYDGTITVTATGGWGTYQYSDGPAGWQTSNIFGGLHAGTYHIYIRDAVHTICTADLGEVIILQPPAHLASTTVPTPVNCFGNSDGILTVSASGGWGTFEYSDDGGLTWQASNIFSGLPTGTYHVIIRDAAHTMCTEDQGIFTVTQPNGALGSTTTHTNVGCYGGSDGTITVNASGGWGTYEYSDNGGSTWQTSNVFNGLLIGTYHVMIRDKSHTMCTEDQGPVIIIQPDVLVASASNNGPICEGLEATFTVCVSQTGGTGPYHYVWSDPIGGFGYPDASCVTGIAVYATHNGIWHVTVTDAHGCTATATTNLVIKQRFNLSGLMHYNNTAYTPLAGIVIGLYQGATQIATSTTTATGYYHFDNICCDAYTLKVTYNPYPVGSINSTDACQVQWWFTHCGLSPYLPIQLVNFFAGDVDWSSLPDWINSTDAYLIQQYFVYGGAPTVVFNRAPWSYAKDGVMQFCNNVPPITTDDITVNLCSTQTIDLLAQVTGDFNRSYIVGGKDASAKVQITYGQTKQVSPNKEFDLQVYVVNPTKVSAASLALNFPTNLVEVMNVTMDGGQLDWNVNGNALRIGWNTMNPLSLNAHATLLTLRLRTTGDFKVGTAIRLALASDPMNELADELVMPIPDAILGVDVIEASPIGIPENSSVSDLSLENHPNPFSNETMFDYSLPFDGNVTLVIHNLLGETVKTLVNEPQTQGDHTFRFDASSIATGVYTATIKLDANGTKLVRTIKLIRGK
jgi:hypothetical protein